jgi:hypothetical protein
MKMLAGPLPELKKYRIMEDITSPFRGQGRALIAC